MSSRIAFFLSKEHACSLLNLEGVRSYPPCEVVHAGIRDHVVQSVELKFNCFFLMPVVDSFPTRLREELEAAYDDDIDEVFDVTAVRNALESRLKALESELHQVSVSRLCEEECTKALA